MHALVHAGVRVACACACVVIIVCFPTYGGLGHEVVRGVFLRPGVVEEKTAKVRGEDEKAAEAMEGVEYKGPAPVMTREKKDLLIVNLV